MNNQCQKSPAFTLNMVFQLMVEDIDLSYHLSEVAQRSQQIRMFDQIRLDQ